MMVSLYKLGKNNLLEYSSANRVRTAVGGTEKGATAGASLLCFSRPLTMFPATKHLRSYIW